MAAAASGKTRANAPVGFLCPIGHDVMVDPVLCADKHTYERELIAKWLLRSNNSPLTREPLANKELHSNVALRQAIQDWQTTKFLRILQKQLHYRNTIRLSSFDKSSDAILFISIWSIVINVLSDEYSVHC